MHHGFAIYPDVVQRLVPVRETGGGFWFRCPLPDRHKRGDRHASGRAWIGSRGQLTLKCFGCGANFREIVKAVGLSAQCLYPDRFTIRSRDQRRRVPMSKIVAVYVYRDRSGQALYEKVRYEPGFDGRSKTFLVRRHVPDEHRSHFDGCPAEVNVYAWGLTAGDYTRKTPDPGPDWNFRRIDAGGTGFTIVLEAVEPVLYRLPELAAADPKQPVFVVEGEKDADQLRELGFVATCPPTGGSAWEPIWSAEMTGRRVVVVPDHSEGGYQHGELVAGSCLRSGAASVRCIDWSKNTTDPGEGGGLGNWIAAYMSAMKPEFVRGEIVELVKRFPEYRS